jgi:hypothetical protein
MTLKRMCVGHVHKIAEPLRRTWSWELPHSPIAHSPTTPSTNALCKADWKCEWSGDIRGNLYQSVSIYINDYQWYLPVNPVSVMWCRKGRDMTRSKYCIWVWVNTYRYIFSGMNIHLPAILGFTRGTRFWPIPISKIIKVQRLTDIRCDPCPAHI